MLDVGELQRELRQIQCQCIREESFRELQALSGSTHRLICGSGDAFQHHCPTPDGFSFWIHDAIDVAFLGLWNGRLFLVPEAERLIDACVQVCKWGDNSDCPFTVLPAEVVAPFNFVEVELLHLSDVNAEKWGAARDVSNIQEADWHELIAKLKANVDECTDSSLAKLTLRLGSAQALTRETSPCSFASFVVHQSLRETADHLQLLWLIHNLSGLTLYDGGWGNRIDRSDPFYLPPDNGARANEPVNWS